MVEIFGLNTLDSRTNKCYSVRQRCIMDPKLTVRIPRKLIENAKKYASRHRMTVTDLITAFLEHLPEESQGLESAPIVQRLTGLLSSNVSIDEYKKHLDEKYG